MPVAFWNDSEDNAAYRNAYFNKFDGVWAHGDFLLINPKTKGIDIEPSFMFIKYFIFYILSKLRI